MDGYLPTLVLPITSWDLLICFEGLSSSRWTPCRNLEALVIPSAMTVYKPMRHRSRVCFKASPYFDGLEIGYILFDLQRRRQGIMTEALSLFTDYLFQSTKIHRVQLIIADGNIASEKVAQKCGFTYEGTARQAVFQRGIHRDMKLYSLLREEQDPCLPHRLFS